MHTYIVSNTGIALIARVILASFSCIPSIVPCIECGVLSSLDARIVMVCMFAGGFGWFG